MFQIHWVKLNMLLKLISPISFYSFNVATQNFYITYVACICDLCCTSFGQH